MAVKRELYVSTGTLVGHVNGYDYRGALLQIRMLAEVGLCDGLELMMLRHYYDRMDSVAEAVRESGVLPATIHCEKDIGTMLSDAGVLEREGKTEAAEKLFLDALHLFRLNCEMAERLRIPSMVLHLWGGRNSDSVIDYNISKIGVLEETAERFGVRLLYENIPSSCTDPHTNWLKLLNSIGSGGLIFDTRFGKLHEQIAETLTDSRVNRYLEHIHISDFAGTYRDFAALRPILHPGEGSVDFTEVARLLDGFGYRGTITLESPVMMGDRWNIPKLAKTLQYIRTHF